MTLQAQIVYRAPRQFAFPPIHAESLGFEPVHDRYSKFEMDPRRRGAIDALDRTPMLLQIRIQKCFVEGKADEQAMIELVLGITDFRLLKGGAKFELAVQL